jgi:hypothetical protein
MGRGLRARHADFLDRKQRDPTPIRASVRVPEVQALRVHVQGGLESRPPISFTLIKDGSGSSHDDCVPITPLDSLDALVSVTVGPLGRSFPSSIGLEGSIAATYGSPAGPQTEGDTRSRADPAGGNSITPLGNFEESCPPLVRLKGQW